MYINLRCNLLECDGWGVGAGALKGDVQQSCDAAAADAAAVAYR